MLLAVDVGNTQTVIGLFANDELLTHWRIATADSMTADEIRVKLGSLFRVSGKPLNEITGVVLGSVVPNLTETWVTVANFLGIATPLVVDHTINTGLELAFDNPAEIGADRLATVVAATERYGFPIIVVDFGTATTLDAVNSKGQFLGGTIGPGVETSATALYGNAARLSEVELEIPKKVIGTDTITQIQAGILLGEALKVDGLVHMTEEEMGEKATVVGTGGLGSRVVPASKTIQKFDSDLTLDGLLALAKRNGIA